MNIRRVPGLVAALISIVVSGIGVGVASPANAVDGPGQVPAPILASSGYHKIVNNWTGKCAEVAGASEAVGALIQQWDCGTATHRRWAAVEVGNGFIQYYNQHSGKCMSLVWGALIVNQQICDRQDPRQWWQWQFADPFGNLVLAAPAAGGACLALRPLSQKNGAPIQIEDCATTSSQLWHSAT